MPAKPPQVEPGQVWRCVGIEVELEVWPREHDAVPGEHVLVPVGSGGAHGRVRAREEAILGLREWTFIRGPR